MASSRRQFFRRLGAAIAGVYVAPLLPIPVAEPAFTLRMVSTPVVARVTKLKATWSEECDQTLCAMYNIRAEEQLVAALRRSL